MPSFLDQLRKATQSVSLEPIKGDHRYKEEAWGAWPFNSYSQSFLHLKQWWIDAFGKLPGESKHQAAMTHFATLQLIEALSPANFLFTNPALLERTIKEGGANLIRGQMNFLNDLYHLVTKTPPSGVENFVVGKNVAITPGKVVFRDDLIELIQYTPTTKTVSAEPILIVPAWIMKYYILDLSPENSMIKYLVDAGHTVFAISWKNPTSDDRYMGLEDYLNLGVLGAIDKITALCNQSKVHAVGYCLGGTLLTLAASVLGRDNDKRLASITLLAAQTDFSEPGDIGVFIDKFQVGLLESVMRPNGYLDSAQMSSAFQMIGAADRKWAQMTKEYGFGERSQMNDLMVWNADGTRLPIRMHSQYLHHMYLNNDLAKGRFYLQGKPVRLEDINCPVFGVGTDQDFVAPWRSVYKMHNTIQTVIEFVLTSGGHNAGIVSPPGLPRRSYLHMTRKKGGENFSADQWTQQAKREEGSWWTHWLAWLDKHSSAPVPARKILGTYPIDGHEVSVQAPGTYVFE